MRLRSSTPLAVVVPDSAFAVDTVFAPAGALRALAAGLFDIAGAVELDRADLLPLAAATPAVGAAALLVVTGFLLAGFLLVGFLSDVALVGARPVPFAVLPETVVDEDAVAVLAAALVVFEAPVFVVPTFVVLVLVVRALVVRALVVSAFVPLLLSARVLSAAVLAGAVLAGPVLAGPVFEPALGPVDASFFASSAVDGIAAAALAALVSGTIFVVSVVDSDNRIASS